MRILRTHWKNILLTFASLLIACMIGEFVVRQFAPPPAATDPYLGRVMRPGGDWDTNGFRNPKVLDHADMVAIGDSQTMGDNATSGEAWPYILSSQSKLSTYSMAVGGFGPVQYALLAERAVLLRPKVAIVGFYFGNDLLDAEGMVYQYDAWKQFRDPSYVTPVDTGKYDNIRLMLGSGARPGSFSLMLLEWRTWIRGHSQLYTLLGNATRSLREKIGVARTFAEKQQSIAGLAEERPDIVYVYDSESPLTTTLSPNYRMDTIDLANSRTKEGWRITKERFLEIKKIFAEAQIPLVVLLIPTKEKVYLEYMKAHEEEIPDAFFEYNRKEDELQKEVLQFCDTNALSCAPALPAMVDAMLEGSILYGNTMDGHPKAPGYRVIGEYLDSYLKERKII